jgi:phospholipid/cholesterol/gamma-HCH transport system ATP-binding protein
LAERKRTTSRSSTSSGRGSSTRRSRAQEIEDEARGNNEPEAKEDEATDEFEVSDEDEATAEAESVEEGDPLAAQGYGEEDFSGRDYIIPGVESDDPDPYKWHTGKKRDHGGEDAIEIIDLVKQFGRTRILNGCNLGLPDNMISMVLGPSGTGKSVLIKHIVGLLYPDSGDVLVHGESIPNMTDDELFEVRKKFGLLFQDGALFGSMNVYDNTAFPLRQHTDKGEDEIDEIVSRRLREVGLAEAMYKMPNELSGGMRKRAGFARALVLDPAIVMFDEPDSGLDPVRTALLCELIREVHEENGGCYLVISHDLGTARRIADFIAVLWKGKIVESGPSDELFNSKNEFVSQFLNADVKGPLAMD